MVILVCKSSAVFFLQGSDWQRIWERCHSCQGISQPTFSFGKMVTIWLWCSRYFLEEVVHWLDFEPIVDEALTVFRNYCCRSAVRTNMGLCLRLCKNWWIWTWQSWRPISLLMGAGLWTVSNFKAIKTDVWKFTCWKKIELTEVIFLSSAYVTWFSATFSVCSISCDRSKRKENPRRKAYREHSEGPHWT